MSANLKFNDTLKKGEIVSSEEKNLTDLNEDALALQNRKKHYAEVLKWQGKLHWDDQPCPIMAAKVKNAANLAG